MKHQYPDDVCHKCGSHRLKWVSPHKATLYEPAQIEGWECLECGHFQKHEPDYDYYPEDFS